MGEFVRTLRGYRPSRFGTDSGEVQMEEGRQKEINLMIYRRRASEDKPLFAEETARLR